MDISLTPAEMKEAESIFPGENWFCYWRTSAALWESKLASLNKAAGPLFIPLYWGFHSENAETFDFGAQKPEADLARLHRILQQTGHEAIWLLPLTSVPLQPNGGLPAFIARTPAADEHGMTQSYLDSDGSVHKMHSLYDPRVYQAFRKWVWHLSQELNQKNISFPVRGLKAFWVGERSAHSYFEDYSSAFQAGFTRFLKQHKLPVRLNEEGVEVSALAPVEEKIQTTRYRKLITDLYTQTAAESLASQWTGEQEYGFLGGAPQDIFPRSSDLWNHQIELMQDLWTQQEWNLMPSSVLIHPRVKRGVIGKFLKDHLSSAFVRQAHQLAMTEESESGHFAPLVFFDIFWDEELAAQAPGELDELGLLGHVQRDYRSCWRWRGRFDFNRESEDENTHKLKFFFGKQMDRTKFQQVLRLFLNGQKVVLDRQGLDPVLEKKLQLFLVENELVPQDINFLSKLTLVRLGEGVLLMYDGQKLREHPLPKKIAFWEHVTKYIQLKHLAIRGEDQFFFNWKTRATGAFELKYDEIRRLSIYNPTTQRVRCQIQGSKQFAFLKVVDPMQAQAKSTPMGVDVEIMAGGWISLDFGHFEG